MSPHVRLLVEKLTAISTGRSGKYWLMLCRAPKPRNLSSGKSCSSMPRNDDVK
jgi:hypothetical protein